MDNILDEEDLDSEFELIFDDDEYDDIDIESILGSESPEMIQQEDEDEYISVTDRILKLDDRLAEDIILRNIESALTSELDPNKVYLNYITLFKKKIAKINKNSSIYNKQYIELLASRLKDQVLSLLEARYSITIGTESDFYYSDEFLTDLEALYEFFFVRHTENLVNYFLYIIEKMKKEIVVRFGEDYKKAESDIFVQTLKKKYINESDIIIIHFMNEIIDFIMESYNSGGYDLFMDMAKLDQYETISKHIIEMLDNYGNGISILNDGEAYEKYFSPLKTQFIRNEILNKVKMKYVEGCVLNENLFGTSEQNEGEFNGEPAE